MQQRLSAILAVADMPALQARLAALEHEASQDSLWEDAGAAQALLTRAADLRSEIEELQGAFFGGGGGGRGALA